MKEKTTAERLTWLMQTRNLKQIDILKLCEPYCKKYNVKLNKNDLSQYVNGKVEPGQFKLTVLSHALNVAEAWLMGYDVPMNASAPSGQLKSPVITSEFETYPVIGDLAAGYDHLALEDWSGETINIPSSYLKGHNKEDYIVLSVKGDSMYPLYHDGDRVLILRQNAAPYSGAICAVLYCDELATLKKVEYGDGFIKLIPLNMNYGPQTLTGEDLAHVSIIGIPRLLIREIEE